MKPYGNTRRDNLQCEYGCCHGDRLLCARGKRGRLFRKERRTNGDTRVVRASKRRARAQGRADADASASTASDPTMEE